MTHILLTGAGFTHNWGAWLASEAFEYLLGCPDVDDELRRELWMDQNKGLGFESTLARLQQEATRPGRQRLVDVLTRALGGMFNTMDVGLRDRHFEFTHELRYQLGPFLARFDAIFTLNQDLFLERKYAPGMELHQPWRWSGFGSPGIGSPGAWANCDPENLITAPRSPLPADQFAIAGAMQPYFKLHGSANWQDDAGGKLLVMGGNKIAAIQNNPLLCWYADQFDKYLQRGARLMVIGYGFNDPHINRSIIDSAQKGLRLFIIDPQGSGVLDKRAGTIKPAQDELMSAAQPILIGASRRPLVAIFGSDIIEHQRVCTFFNW